MILHNRVYIASRKTTTPPIRARFSWTQCYKKCCLCLVPATQSWNSFHRTHIDFILFPCFRFRRHFSFFVLIFLQETKQQFCRVALISLGQNAIFFLSTNQEQTKDRNQSAFSRTWHPLHVFPRLTQVAWFCFEFWLVHGAFAFVVSTMVHHSITKPLWVFELSDLGIRYCLYWEELEMNTSLGLCNKL